MDGGGGSGQMHAKRKPIPMAIVAISTCFGRSKCCCSCCCLSTRTVSSRSLADASLFSFSLVSNFALAFSKAALAASGATSAADIRHLGRPVIRFSDQMWADISAIRSFLFKNMYRAPSVMTKRAEVTRIVEDLFPLFLENPDLLPEHWAAQVAAAGDDRTALARMVCDYIAGMTDRYAYRVHARLIGTAD